MGLDSPNHTKSSPSGAVFLVFDVIIPRMAVIARCVATKQSTLSFIAAAHWIASLRSQ
jgi:hypothetical protein